MKCIGTMHRTVEMGHRVMYRCTAFYYGGWTPTMRWWGPAGAVRNSTTVSNRTSLLKGYVSTVATVTATPELNGKNHVCIVRWHVPFNLPAYHATNIPRSNLSFATKGITVLCKHCIYVVSCGVTCMSETLGQVSAYLMVSCHRAPI